MEEDNVVNVFVPGRLSLIGELSDFVSDYKKKNKAIKPGKAIAIGIDSGIYAIAKKNDDKFIFELGDFYLKCGIKLKNLEEIARSNSFYSYACAVVLYMTKNYDVGGIELFIEDMDIPIKKGLGMSAMICYIVAKSYNKLYDLDLESYEIMKIAYESEHIANSMCGRLDQACINSLSLSEFTFEERKLGIEKIKLNVDMNLVIVDLNGNSETKDILKKLHTCFPVPKTQEQKFVFDTLCYENYKNVVELKKYMNLGDLEKIGEILFKSQNLRELIAKKYCPSLDFEKLNSVLKEDFVLKNIYGARSVGYSGDGCLALLAKNKECQKNLIKYIRDKFKYKTFEFDILKTHRIRKALLIIDDNLCFEEENLYKILNGLDKCSIEKIGLIVSKEKSVIINEFLNKNITKEQFINLTDKEKRNVIYKQHLAEKVECFVKNDKMDIYSVIKSAKNGFRDDSLLVVKNEKILSTRFYNCLIKSTLEKYDNVDIPFVCVDYLSKDKTKYYQTKCSDLKIENLENANRIVLDSNVYNDLFLNDNFNNLNYKMSELIPLDTYMQQYKFNTNIDTDFSFDEKVAFLEIDDFMKKEIKF